MEKLEPILERIQQRGEERRQQQQRISEKVAEFASDHAWAPAEQDCSTCSSSNYLMEDMPGRFPFEFEGEIVMATCPRQSEDCPLGLARAKEKARKEQRSEEQWLQRVQIGLRYWDVSRERMRLKDDILPYLDDLKNNIREGMGLVLLGPVGVGKTGTLSLIGKEARATGYSAWYTTVTRLMRSLLEKDRKDDDDPDYFDPKRSRLLLLDEFGAAYESDYAMAAFEDYIGWRYDNKLATCVAGNVTPDQLLENQHYIRMVDRWRETCIVLKIVGDSMRAAQ